MRKENFGEALRSSYDGKKPKKEGREAPPIQHTEETAEEAERLSGGTRRGIEDFPDHYSLSPEQSLILKETIREALDPKNKNSQAARIIREEARGLANMGNNQAEADRQGGSAILKPKKKPRQGNSQVGDRAA